MSRARLLSPARVWTETGHERSRADRRARCGRCPPARGLRRRHRGPGPGHQGPAEAQRDVDRAGPSEEGGGAAATPERARDRGRRHALGRRAMDAQRPAATSAKGTDLRELVRAVPAVLPVPRQLPHGQIRPQPQGHEPRRAVRVRRRSATSARSRRCCRRPATGPRWSGKYLNGYGEQTMRNGQSSLEYVPPGWTRWRAGSDHVLGPIDPFNGGTYAYFNLIENVDGEAAELRRPLLHRRDGAADPVVDQSLRQPPPTRGSSGGPRSPRTTARR